METSNQDDWRIIPLGHYNVGRSCQEDHSRYYCEESKKNQTKSIQNHRSEFPITFSIRGVFIISDLLRDDPELF